MLGERVLIVEDNEKNMKLVRDVLQATGYSTLEATTGEEAIELSLSQAPALVLMDVQLPGIDGVEALERLRQNERTASIPVLALTAQAMSGDRERFLEAGFDGYLAKPVDVGELSDRPRSSSSTTCRRTCACSRQCLSRVATRW
jgi:two-component system cell cycle response regulator DivK